MLPALDATTGYLPPGIHDASWEEFVARFGFNAHRQRLLSGLKEALRALQDAGCRTALIDGSFVTSKLHPGDYDAIWDSAGVDETKLDNVLLLFENRRAAMKTKFFGELFPALLEGDPGPPLLEFFQHDRNGRPKGIVRLHLGVL